MSNNCLKTQLKDTVNNNSLPYFNAIRLVNKQISGTPTLGTNLISLASNGDIIVKSADGSACFSVSVTGALNPSSDIPSTGYVSEATIPVSAAIKRICFANMDCEIVVFGKDKITNLSQVSGSETMPKNYGIKDFSDFDYMDLLGVLNFNGMDINGEYIPNNPVLTFVNINNIAGVYAKNPFKLDIEKIGKNAQLRTLTVPWSNTYGNLDVMITNLVNNGYNVPGETIKVQDTDVYGDLGVIAELMAGHGQTTVTIYGNTHIKYGTRNIDGNSWVLVTDDNGATYKLKLATTLKATYTISTHTWQYE